MSPPARAAQQIRRYYGLRAIVSETALDGVLKNEGLKVIKLPAEFPIPEFLRGHTIGIRSDQSTSWRKWLKAHALGHYLLHRGNQLTSADDVIIAKQERQADLFAGWLLLAHAWQGETPDEIAEKCGVPVERAQWWAQEVNTTGEIAVGW
jgi:hypothetical protein